ncbi:MAG: UvrD-helicase domain-containing protein [Synergistaceae bacterium]|jgi:DNA helicase-2/ATP-dependent DNA helicase PcrA|nr:UvrD-helicase domain-containing protein [Synergistaceae bacterium]
MAEFSGLRLNPEQKEAVEWRGGHELVLAGAGSGKTRVLAAKIAHLVKNELVMPHRIMAVTFTNKAAREMADRVRSLVGENLCGMQVSTFHSWGLRFLLRNRDGLSDMGYPPGFTIFDRSDCRSLVKKLAKEHGFEAKECGEIADSISKTYAACDPRTLDARIDEHMYGIYRQYRNSLKEQGAFDFDDLMILPLHLMLSNEARLARERANTEWVLVDEYQDVNTPQYTLLKLLVGENCRIMAVGDPDQSIYGWRGADMSLILRFEDDFPGARVVVLDRNYRSTGNILDAANSVIRHNSMRMEKNLRTEEKEGAPVCLTLARNDIEEAENLAGEIERLVGDGYNYRDISVLYRMNALSRGYEQALLERGIPYKIVRGVAYYERKEIKDVLAMLRLAVNPRDAASLERVANVPARGLGKKAVADLARYLSLAEGSPAEVWDELRDAPPLRGRAGEGASLLADIMGTINRTDSLEGAIAYIMYNGAYADYIREEFPDDWEERIENIQELASIMPDSGDIADALAEAALFTDQETILDEGAHVNLLTLHAAKGLEFPVVFIVGLEEGVFPSSRAVDDERNTVGADAIEEERRLCYVGMTRARERLYMSGVSSRLIFGGIKRSPFSRFIRELPDGVKIDDRTKRGGGSDVHRGGNRRSWRW